MIPDELKQVKQWTHSFGPADLKRPTHTHYKPNGALTYDQAKKIAGEALYVGFYVTKADAYVLGDIDHVDDPSMIGSLPIALADMLSTYPTYCESSPSGKGVRFVYKLSEVDDKNKVEGNTFYISDSTGMGKKQEAQINIAPPWMTITGKQTLYSADNVATITLDRLGEVFTLRYPQLDVKKVVGDQITTTLLDVKNWLSTIPLDQNPRIRRAYERVFKCHYAHYEFWIKILMALHNYGELTGRSHEALEAAIEWSRKDVASFESDEDVVKHWRSFKAEGDNVVSYKTIFYVAYGHRLRWPSIKKQTKEEREKGVPPKPIITEYANFKAMLDYYCVTLHRDENDPSLVYLTGDEDMMDKYFRTVYGVEVYFGKYYGPFSRDTLIPAFHMWCQQRGFTGMSHMQVRQFINNVMASTRVTINLVRQYFEMPYQELPDEYRVSPGYRAESSFEALFSCLRIEYQTEDKEREEDLYRSYYKKWLMGLVRNIWFRDSKDMNNCILLLTGKEQIRKTSHFRYLLPEFMRSRYITSVTHGFDSDNATRDISKIASSSLILFWDELEQFLKQGMESNFKKVIDGQSQTFIDKYETTKTTTKPIAIYGATSNQATFNIGSEGSRRIFHIPVNWVDTDRMNTMCWHKIINELKTEVEWGLRTGDTPWLLSNEQLLYQSQLHNNIRAEGGLDIILKEVFDFDEPLEFLGHQDAYIIPGVRAIQVDKTGRMLTIRDIKRKLDELGQESHFNQAYYKNALERLCGAYTGTLHTRKTCETPSCVIYRGLAIQNNKYRKWVMPPIRAEYERERFAGFRKPME